MGFATYAAVLRNPDVRRIILLGLIIRVPFFAGGIALTLHVVTGLHRSYTDAGLLAAVTAAALGISGPWRGRRLDQLGVRRAITPSLVVHGITWSIAPWVGFWPLVALAGVAGLYTIPLWSIVRTVLIGAVPDASRTSALSLDAIATELTYMVGPVLGVLAATMLPTGLALFLCEMAVLAGALLIWWVNPSMAGSADHDPAVSGPARPLRLTPAVLAVLAMAIATVMILTGEDLGTVAALRFWEHPGDIGWVLGLWGFGSAVGGLVYGSLRRPPSAATVLLLLGLSTVLIAVAHDQVGFTVLLVISGAFCAPAITSNTTMLARLVPPERRGEAMGWHGSAMMIGSALGAPLIGAALDHGGWRWGLLVAGIVGLAIALAGIVATARVRVVDEPEPALETV